MKYKTLFDGLARPFVLIIYTLGVLAMSIMQIPITEFVRDAYMVVLVFFFTARTAEKAMEQHRQRDRAPDILQAKAEQEEVDLLKHRLALLKQENIRLQAGDQREPAIFRATERPEAPSTDPPTVHRDASRQAGGLR